jgi:hypothetical protein
MYEEYPKPSPWSDLDVKCLPLTTSKSELKSKPHHR